MDPEPRRKSKILAGALGYNVTMQYPLRPISPDELPAFAQVDRIAFGLPTPTELALDGWRAYELERTLGAFDGDDIVGTGRLYSFELTLPGGACLPAAGVSWIAVLATHRRRGILRALITRQLDDAVERGEPISILNASESAIYRRFGFGIATFATEIELDRRDITFTRSAPPGRVRLVDRERAAELFPPVFDRARLGQPGAVSRPAPWWEQSYFQWGEERRRGRSDVVFEAPDGSVDGFVSYHVEQRFSGGVASSALEVQDLVAVTPDAHAALWQHVVGVDLVRPITAWLCSIDAPLRWLLTEPRAVRTSRVGDWLWARLLDVPVALAARRYAMNAGLVLEVIDDERPDGAAAGRFELEGGPDGASCRPTIANPDLVLDVADLGAIYLGGVRPSTLARAGLIEERTSGALARADAMFAAEAVPFCNTWF